MSQLCGAGFKAKMAMAIICLLCFGFIVYFGASFGGGILGGAIGSWMFIIFWFLIYIIIDW